MYVLVKLEFLYPFWADVAMNAIFFFTLSESIFCSFYLWTVNNKNLFNLGATNNTSFSFLETAVFSENSQATEV